MFVFEPPQTRYFHLGANADPGHKHGHLRTNACHWPQPFCIWFGHSTAVCTHVTCAPFRVALQRSVALSAHSSSSLRGTCDSPHSSSVLPGNRLYNKDVVPALHPAETLQASGPTHGGLSPPKSSRLKIHRGSPCRTFLNLFTTQLARIEAAIRLRNR